MGTDKIILLNVPFGITVHVSHVACAYMQFCC